MIQNAKFKNALYAMQGIVIQARFVTLNKGQEDRPVVVRLLDALDDMTRMLSSETDETERFRWMLNEVGETNKCNYIVERFENQLPAKW